MPDDRELADTHAAGALLADRFPGQAATDEAVVAAQAHLGTDEALRKAPFGFLFWFAIGWVTVVVLSAVLADLLPLANPNFQDYNAINQAPSIHHLLGTDDLGRDLLSRLIYGARVSLFVGFFAVIIGLVIGGTLGLISGYKGGVLDISLNAASFIILAFPAIVAVIAIVAFWGHSLLKITIILGVATIPLKFRVIRASSLAFAQRDFVVAAKTMGARTSRILFKEILPNVVPIALTFSLISMAGIIVVEGTLAFLGLSIPLPTSSWGNMISEGSANGNLGTNPYIMLWPAFSMFLLLWAINLIGDRLRKRFDIREGVL